MGSLRHATVPFILAVNCFLIFRNGGCYSAMLRAKECRAPKHDPPIDGYLYDRYNQVAFLRHTKYMSNAPSCQVFILSHLLFLWNKINFSIEVIDEII